MKWLYVDRHFENVLKLSESKEFEFKILEIGSFSDFNTTQFQVVCAYQINRGNFLF